MSVPSRMLLALCAEELITSADQEDGCAPSACLWRRLVATASGTLALLEAGRYTAEACYVVVALRPQLKALRIGMPVNTEVGTAPNLVSSSHARPAGRCMMSIMVSVD